MTFSAFGVDHEGLVSKNNLTTSDASTGRKVTGTVLPGYHGAVAGKRGHKLRAMGNQVGGSVAGGMLGGIAGSALTRGRAGGALAGQMVGGYAGAAAGTNRAQNKGHFKQQKVGKSAFLEEPIAKGFLKSAKSALSVTKDALKVTGAANTHGTAGSLAPAKLKPFKPAQVKPIQHDAAGQKTAHAMRRGAGY